MRNLRLMASLRVAAVLGTATGLLSVGSLMTTAHPAGADPAIVTSYTGVGSDTLQNLMDAYAGAEPFPPSANAKFYIPISSSAASGNKILTSWDAIPLGGTAAAPGCITAKLGGSNFDRPNGSGNGITALSDAITGATWFNPVATASCTGQGITGANVAGQIDFARSSRGPKTGTSPCTAGSTTQCLDFIPFARDAVSVAFFDHRTGHAATVATTDLHTLYSSTTGSITLASGDTLKACLTQSGSGTTNFFEGAIGVTDAQAEAASHASGCTANPSLLEENNGDAFNTFASTLPAGTDAVVDFSVGSWIAQANGVATDSSSAARAAGVDLSAIDALPKPYTGSPGTEAPNPTFYASTTYGRNINVVVQESRMGTFGDAGLKSLFLNGTSVICSAGAQATAHTFGFDSLASGCGTPVTANLFS